MLFEARQTKKKRQRSIRKERNQARKPSARLRLVSFVPLLSIFIKESESRLYLFVSNIATSLSGNSSSEWTLFPVTKWQLHWGANRLFVSLSFFVL